MDVCGNAVITISTLWCLSLAACDGGRRSVRNRGLHMRHAARKVFFSTLLGHLTAFALRFASQIEEKFREWGLGANGQSPPLNPSSSHRWGVSYAGREYELEFFSQNPHALVQPYVPTMRKTDAKASEPDIKGNSALTTLLDRMCRVCRPGKRKCPHC